MSTSLTTPEAVSVSLTVNGMNHALMLDPRTGICPVTVERAPSQCHFTDCFRPVPVLFEQPHHADDEGEHDRHERPDAHCAGPRRPLRGSATGCSYSFTGTPRRCRRSRRGLPLRYSR
jgi:hypothetical protein